MFDAGYTQLLFDDAWQAGDLLAALEFLFAKETQDELCTIMERSEASSLDAERKNQQDKRGEKKTELPVCTALVRIPYFNPILFGGIVECRPWRPKRRRFLNMRRYQLVL